MCGHGGFSILSLSPFLHLTFVLLPWLNNILLLHPILQNQCVQMCIHSLLTNCNYEFEQQNNWITFQSTIIMSLWPCFPSLAHELSVYSKYSEKGNKRKLVPCAITYEYVVVLQWFQILGWKNLLFIVCYDFALFQNLWCKISNLTSDFLTMKAFGNLMMTILNGVSCEFSFKWKMENVSNEI